MNKSVGSDTSFKIELDTVTIVVDYLFTNKFDRLAVVNYLTVE